ncbi:2-hydroxy-3-oxopropionate reductase [Leadbettera azotonutricia]|uniref:2-hydroxy-3-oxopropionate reductase n=1 Tax=Leadbettera azotonutricia (strain ATCC BAA-888 / DSM 13862 / ZAS-9) TaxID=545695 RepID=F5YED9_LEAAZ|nr:2-hydroxy-3-oxopropionate reductase [Leadbettera azotonutricia]AEF83050.1 2-hydroxy-3-oxopropionate reductase [Leadbettera azotonutricia ZAS-9]
MVIGFIGLGIMGRPMAKNLIKAGYKLIVYDKFAKSDDIIALGAEKASSNKEVASKTDLIITMLPNSPHVKEAILGSGGVIEGIKSGSIVVDMSSIAPAVSQEVGAALKAKDVSFLDAPVSGGEPKAIDGTLAIMVGGDKQVFDTVKPILEKMGSSVVLVGDIGAGNVTKLANQIIVALNIAAVSEAFTLATKAGVNPVSVFDAIKGGLAGSTVMNAKIPMILEGNFKPGFRIELHIKDLQNALDTAHSLGAPIPLTASVMETLQALKTDGFSANDHSAIVRYYEKLAKIEVRK